MDVIDKGSLIDLGSDTTLGALIGALEGHNAKALVLSYGGREIRAGYHVTEVKAGEFVTLDCGGNPDHWRETILQVEDLASERDEGFMQVRTFRAILDKVSERVRLDPDARLTFEVSDPDSPMQVFDPTAVACEDGRVVVTLTNRPAVCKPRHRAFSRAASAGCCAQPASRSEERCCA
jgi:hypothetical protein